MALNEDQKRQVRAWGNVVKTQVGDDPEAAKEVLLELARMTREFGLEEMARETAEEGDMLVWALDQLAEEEEPWRG